MNKKVSVDLSVAGVDKLLKAVSDYKVWIERGAERLVARLADEGYSIASTGFSRAVYDGTNDVSVSVEVRDKMCRGIVAVGATVLFIEFGTGIVYPDNHPDAAQLGMNRGEYGAGHGKQRTWGYYGEPGTNGVVKAEKAKGTLVLTHGNPANMTMYKTVQELEQDLGRIAREVFM